MNTPNTPCKLVTLDELLAHLDPRSHERLLANLARPTVQGIVCLENMELGSPDCGRLFAVDYGPGGFCKSYDDVLRTKFDEIETHAPVAHYVKPLRAGKAPKKKGGLIDCTGDGDLETVIMVNQTEDDDPVFILKFQKPKADARETIVDIALVRSGPDTFRIHLKAGSTRSSIFVEAVLRAMGVGSKAISKTCRSHRGDEMVLTISNRGLAVVLIKLRTIGTDEANELSDDLALCANTVLKNGRNR